LARSKSGESSVASNSLSRRIKSDIAVFQGIMGSDRFGIGVFELLEDDFALVMPNKLLADYLGMDLEAMAGRKASELHLPARAIEQWVATLKECREKKSIIREVHHSGYPGRETWLECGLNYIEGSETLFFGIAVDITERKQIENALEANEAFLSNVFDSIQDGISVLDKDLNIIRVNHVMEEWYPHAMPIRGKKCFSAYHGRSAPCEKCPSLGAISEKEARSGVVPFEGQGGSQRGWLDIHSFPLKDDEDNVVGVIEHVRNITERKRAEEALHESEEKYRLLAESAQDMIFVIDGDFRVKYVNHAAAGAFGVKQWEMIGKLLVALFPEENALRMKEGLLRIMSSGMPCTSEMTHRFHQRDIPMHVILTPLFDANGKVSGVMGISRDITDRKKAEAALQESERTKLALMDGIPESLLLLDRNGIILDANCVLAKMLRKSKKELIGAYAYDFIDPGTARLRKSKIDEVFLTGLPAVFEDERAGEYFENIVTPVLSKDGVVEKVAIIAINITDRKRTEAALLDAKAQAELYLDLLGHDINNMHQIALGYLELARSKQPEPQHLEYLDKPIEVLYRSARLIKNVRKLQKLRDDALGSGIVDLAGVLMDVQREYGETAGKVLTLDLNGNERCHVRANELLYDVFANLVSNAINHTGDGTNIAIVMEMEEADGGRYYRVSVEDDGPGIPDDIKGRIFDRMLKGTTRAKGMGLGLYLVKSLVESYGGRVWVEDRVPGDHRQGAKFVVMLPAVE
jgi:PAS domain S-box-containing protein